VTPRARVLAVARSIGRLHPSRHRPAPPLEPDISTSTDTDALVNDYLRRLTIAVGSIPQTRRVQIIKDISSLVYETRSMLPVQSPAAVLDILDRVGRPENIARRAPADQRAVIESRRRRWLLVIGLVMIGLGMLGCLAAILLGSSPGSGRPLRQSSVARVAPTRVTPENILVEVPGEGSQTRWAFQHHDPRSLARHEQGLQPVS